MKVQNFKNSKGKAIANQIEIITDNGRIFQSYDSVIAKIECCKVTLDGSKWNYSTTTSKYRNIFLGETTKETMRKIKEGIYTLADLNN